MNAIDTLADTVAELISRGQSPGITLDEIVACVGQSLAADRCFLYVRRPQLGQGRTAFCWRRHPGIPTRNTIQPHWQADTTDLPDEDPLIRAGLAMKPSVYVDDVETAGPQVLNRQFEQETFGHRALIHAHIQQNGQLWGILQPCMFDAPRHWTAQETRQIDAILPLLQPLIAAFVASA